MAIYHLMYRTNAAGRIPAAADMPLGRLAVNLTDERLFFKNASNVVVEPQPRSHTHPISQVDGLQAALDSKQSTPVGSTSWWPLRSSVPSGKLPYDGQTVLRSVFPDLTAMVLAGTVPVVDEAAWQSNILLRGSYTLGDGSTTIRLPDFNGKSVGSRGAVFLRGDGALSGGTNGLIQQDALQSHGHQINIKTVTGGEGQPYGQADYGLGTGSQYGTEGPLNNAREAVETRPLNVTGVWVVQAFGTVSNPGDVDISALATQVQGLDDSINFVHYYANGSPAAPATIIANTRYVFTNPFPGYEVLVDVQIKPTDGSGAWFYPGWASTYVSTVWQSHGVSVSQLSTGQIICQTGSLNVAAPASIGGGGGGEISTMSTALIRLRVWKVRGLL